MPKKKIKRGIPESQLKYCSGCGKKIHSSAKSCPKCGYTAKSEAAEAKTKAIVGLVLNILVLPGVGTIVGGETRKGVLQLVLFLVSLPLLLLLVGFPLLIGVWIWALISSIQQINRAD